MIAEADYRLKPVYAAIHELVREWVKDIAEKLESGEYVDFYKIENVENEDRSGFHAYTSGGVDCVGYRDLYSDWSSGYSPKAVHLIIDSDLADIREEWGKAHPNNTYDWIYDSEDHPTFDGFKSDEAVREHWREKFYDWEAEGMMDAGTYFWKVRALYHAAGSTHNETGEDEVLFLIGLCTDIDYGRDSVPWLSAYGADPQTTKWLFERTVKASDVTPGSLEKMAAEAVNVVPAQFGGSSNGEK
jgi:hypothetical protein